MTSFLGENARKYFDIRLKKVTNRIDKEGKMRFDLAEGVLKPDANFSYSALPDRNSVALKNAISNYLGILSTNISIFAGADEVIEIIPRIFLGEGEKALVVIPVFDRHIYANIKVGGKVLTHALDYINDFSLSLEEGEIISKKSRQENVKLIWLCSPNNPTGKIVDLNVIKKIAVENPNSLVIINEVYQEFYSFDPTRSSVSLLEDCKNILIIRSFSKAFCLAGYRIGYVVGSAELIQSIEGFRTLYNVSTPAQDAAMDVLLNRVEIIKGFTEEINQERERVTRSIAKLKNFQIIFQSKTNFIFMRHKTKNLFNELLAQNIVSADWSMAPGIENLGFIRISLNTPPLNDSLIQVLRAVNESL
jgi:histidinol-phosphate aminotransferase